MELRLEIPLDDDGYLDRECAACGRHFRWHDGPVGDVPDDAPGPDEYYCPYCGAAAPADEWLTTDQVEALQQLAFGAVERGVDRTFRSAAGRSPHLRYESGGRPVSPPAPMELDETDRLIAVASPCHPYEPVKVATRSVSELHCLVCGSPFVV